MDFAVAMDTFWHPMAKPVSRLCLFERLICYSLELGCQYAHMRIIVAIIVVAMVIEQHGY